MMCCRLIGQRCDICRAVAMMWNCEMQSNACRVNAVGLLAAVWWPNAEDLTPRNPRKVGGNLGQRSVSITQTSVQTITITSMALRISGIRPSAICVSRTVFPRRIFAYSSRWFRLSQVFGAFNR